MAERRCFAGDAGPSAPRNGAGSQLWYDDRDIPALQEDIKERADVQESQSRSIKALCEAGFDTGSVVDAVTSGDMKRLSHTGLLSVQLQEPGVDPSQNGKAELVVPESRFRLAEVQTDG